MMANISDNIGLFSLVLGVAYAFLGFTCDLWCGSWVHAPAELRASSSQLCSDDWEP